MKTNKKHTTRNNPKQSKKEKNSSGTMKIFYVVMLLLIASSSLIRVAGASRHTPQSGAIPTPQVSPVGGNGTVARVFVFRKEDSGSGICEDLAIPATGDAVYSNCGNGVEKQYTLSDSERGRLQDWIGQFQPVNYDHTDKTRTGDVTTQLYLNGQGSRRAGDADTQHMIDFATALVAEIAVKP